MDGEVIPIEFHNPKSKIAPRWEASKKIREKALIEAHKFVPNGVLASDEQLEELYAMGYKLYQSGRYKDAHVYFKILTIAHPKESRYAMAKAATEHMQKEYGAAVITYYMAGVLDPTNPLPFYHSADCYMKMDELMKACVALKMAIKRCGENPSHKIIKDRCSTLLEKGIENLKAHKEEIIIKFKEKFKNFDEK